MISATAAMDANLRRKGNAPVMPALFLGALSAVVATPLKPISFVNGAKSMTGICICVLFNYRWNVVAVWNICLVKVQSGGCALNAGMSAAVMTILSGDGRWNEVLGS